MKYLLLFFLASCSWYPDNPIEECLEQQIENVTGLDIDLTADDEEL